MSDGGGKAALDGSATSPLTAAAMASMVDSDGG